MQSGEGVIRIKNKKNYGFSIAVNQGIKESKGEYVVLLNNDTVAEPEWLENLVSCIEKHENIFSVCSKMIRYNEKDKNFMEKKKAFLAPFTFRGNYFNSIN